MDNHVVNHDTSEILKRPESDSLPDELTVLKALAHWGEWDEVWCARTVEAFFVETMTDHQKAYFENTRNTMPGKWPDDINIKEYRKGAEQSSASDQVVLFEHEGNYMRAIKLNGPCAPADNLLLTPWGEVIIGPCEYVTNETHRNAFLVFMETHALADGGIIERPTSDELPDGIEEIEELKNDGDWETHWCAITAEAFFVETMTEEEKAFFENTRNTKPGTWLYPMDLTEKRKLAVQEREERLHAVHEQETQSSESGWGSDTQSGSGSDNDSDGDSRPGDKRSNMHQKQQPKGKQRR